MKDFVNSLADTLGVRVDNIVYLDVVDSTHATCTRLMEQMQNEDFALGTTLVIARQQLTGAGRGDRRWESPRGGLYLSWIRSNLSDVTVSMLPMLAAAAAREALASIGVTGTGIKWPNDIIVEGMKIAGILVHARDGQGQWATVGLGVNLETVPDVGATAALPPTAVHRHIDPRPYPQVATDIISVFVASLERSIDDPGPALDDWERNLIHRPGETLRVRVARDEVIVGVFDGLTPEGFLRLRQDDGERIVTGGDVVETD